MFLYYLGIVLLCSVKLHNCGESFDHDIEFEHDSGNVFVLKSKGRFADIVDLDDVTTIKRLLCRHGLIMIAFEDGASPPILKPGQIVLGSSKWKCFNTGHSPQGSGIYTRIKQIIRPKDSRIDIVTENIGPFDLLDEANIHLHYKQDGSPKKEPDNQSKTRKKRYSSNLLSNMLNNINWTANIDLSVPNNYNMTSQTEQNQFSLERFYGLGDLMYWDLKDQDNGRENFTQLMIPMWNMECLSCYGFTNFSYVFELVIYKVNNKPVIKKYISQIEATTELHTDYNMQFERESALTGSRLLWARPVTEMFRVPLAAAPNVPPVELVVTTNDIVMAKVHGSAAAKTKLNVKFDVKGKYTLSQNFATQSMATGDVSSQSWQINNNSFEINSPSKVNVTASLSQTIVFNASVHWSGKDVSAILSPPAITTIKPEVKIQTSFKELSKTYDAQLDVKADFKLSKAKFVVEAFGLHIWNVLLASGFDQRMSLLKANVGKVDHSNCRGQIQRGPPLSVDEICGKMKKKIVSKDPEFKSLSPLVGDSILIYETNGTTWCGETGTPCISCQSSVDICHRRYVHPKLAYSIVRMQNYVETEMQTRKLVILEAFDEPTSINPQGKHGNGSLFYEGRAAYITITQENSSSIETSKAVILRLSQMAVCSLFDYVQYKIDTNTVFIAVTDGEKKVEDCASGQQSDRCVFRIAMEYAGKNPPAALRFPGLPNELQEGHSYPHSRTVDSICGGRVSTMSRYSYGIENRLFYYKENAVEFSNEGNSNEWCGNPLRMCSVSCRSDVDSAWDWCATRMMTPRLALRLRRLSFMVQAEPGNARLKVIASFLEPKESQPILPNNVESVLYQEGRAASITLNPPSGITLGKLATFAVKSGFDFVQYNNPNFIQVFVSQQDNYRSQVTFFPSGLMPQGIPIASLFDDIEYSLMKAHKSEPRKPLLLDGYDSNTKLSERYRISDFQAPGFRYFRIDEAIVQCLERVSEDLGEKVEVISGSGYRARSLNLDNIDTRQKEERYRFQLGQAVEIRLGSNSSSVQALIDLGKSVLRSCPIVTRLQHRGIGLGCHIDRLYMDVRPIPLGDEDKHLSVWNSGGQTLYIEMLTRVYTALTGGPVVSPMNKNSACRIPIGKDYVHLSFQMNQPAQCRNTNEVQFCSNTKSHRENEAHKLQVRMSSAAGSDNLPRREILTEIEECVVGQCGGCSGSGPIWDKKVKACSRMVKKFIDHASRPFQKMIDKVTFFNTENSDSSVHSLACHFGFICVENVQLYSLFMPLITSIYKPDETKSVEEKLFAVEDNPSPLLEIVSQELAIRSVGTVRVFVDNYRDIMVLRNVLKVLMVYNKNVTAVEFHLTEDLKPEDVKASLRRKIESWATSSCTEWSRFAVVPYTVHVIPQPRHKRSVTYSVPRNHAKMSLNNWEYDWLRKL